MKKRNRTAHDYSKYAPTWNGIELSGTNEAYYGLHRDGERIKLDIKRMRKLGNTGVPESVLVAASAIPRNTVYFLPNRRHRRDYTVNRFRDTLKGLSDDWREYKLAFSMLRTPEETAQTVRLDRLLTGADDHEDATVAGFMAGVKRAKTYQKLWLSQCAQFIHQMATELDALLLKICAELGFAEKDVNRGKLLSFLNDTVQGSTKAEALNGYPAYAKFFAVSNMLKHNTEDLFEKLKNKYPEMLLTDKYVSGVLSQYYLKIGDGYIESTLSDLLPFYESLCSEFFGEDTEAANWNYDDYFAEKVKKTIEKITNPLDV